MKKSTNTNDVNAVIHVGIDVHKSSFTICCLPLGEEKVEYYDKIEPTPKAVLTYLNRRKMNYGMDALFICAYEAGCLGYSLYRDLSSYNVPCIIMAPTTMACSVLDRKTKTDIRDASRIARCLAHNDFSPVYIPSDLDEQVKNYLRMRDDHQKALKVIKQQISAFCLHLGRVYDGTKNSWTQTHLKWLRELDLDELDRETLDEYLITYEYLAGKIKRLDERIEEIAQAEAYCERVKRMSCLLGIKTHTALTTIVETGDFNRFPTASHYAAYLGLVPGEHSSGDGQTRLGITKAGNSHVRCLLVEAS